VKPDQFGDGSRTAAKPQRIHAKVTHYYLIYSPELGILSDERYARHRREVKAPIAEILQCPLAFAGVHLMKARIDQTVGTSARIAGQPRYTPGLRREPRRYRAVVGRRHSTPWPLTGTSLGMIAANIA
jgi:hypothetical protein